MPHTLVSLPVDVGDDFDVYLNGVRQERDVDFRLEDHTLIFERSLRRDRVSGWRWLLGAWGIGTYRQNDIIDIRYTRNGEQRLAHALELQRIE